MICLETTFIWWFISRREVLMWGGSVAHRLIPNDPLNTTIMSGTHPFCTAISAPGKILKEPPIPSVKKWIHDFLQNLRYWNLHRRCSCSKLWHRRFLVVGDMGLWNREDSADDLTEQNRNSTVHHRPSYGSCESWNSSSVTDIVKSKLPLMISTRSYFHLPKN